MELIFWDCNEKKFVNLNDFLKGANNKGLHKVKQDGKK